MRPLATSARDASMAPRSGRSTVPRERTQLLPLSSLSQHQALLC